MPPPSITPPWTAARLLLKPRSFCGCSSDGAHHLSPTELIFSWFLTSLPLLALIFICWVFLFALQNFIPFSSLLSLNSFCIWGPHPQFCVSSSSCGTWIVFNCPLLLILLHQPLETRGNAPSTQQALDRLPDKSDWWIASHAWFTCLCTWTSPLLSWNGISRNRSSRKRGDKFKNEERTRKARKGEGNTKKEKIPY